MTQQQEAIMTGTEKLRHLLERMEDAPRGRGQAKIIREIKENLEFLKKFRVDPKDNVIELLIRARKADVLEYLNRPDIREHRSKNVN